MRKSPLIEEASLEKLVKPVQIKIRRKEGRGKKEEVDGLTDCVAFLRHICLHFTGIDIVIELFN